jgi:hypothetical protein
MILLIIVFITVINFLFENYSGTKYVVGEKLHYNAKPNSNAKYAEDGAVEYAMTLNKRSKAIRIQGSLGSWSYNDFIELSKKNPSIKIVELNNILGSYDALATTMLAQYIFRNGYKTKYVPGGVGINSGGVDLLVSGNELLIPKGFNSKLKKYNIGIHS